MSMEKSNRLLEEFLPNSYEEWAKEAEESLKGKPLDKLNTKTYEGFELKPIYRLDDVKNIKHLENNLPGQFPFVRGCNPDGYKKKAWNVEQEINYPAVKDYNAALAYDLKRGQDSIALKFNDKIVSHLQNKKYDTACPSTVVFNLEDLKAAFEGIDINNFDLHLLVTNFPVVFFSLFNAYLKSSKIELSSIKGTFRIDPLGNLARHGELKMDIEKYYQVIALIVNYLDKHNSNMKTIEVDTSVYTDGGATAIQEIAYAIATGAEYIRGIADRNVDINSVAKKMTFTLGIGANFFMEIAKVRALRMLWANIMKEFGADEDAQKIYIHTKTTKANKTKLDAYVNMLRVTSESLAAVVAGTNAHTVLPFDSEFGLPQEFSRRISRNTQLFLQEECNLRESIDPAGGSWYIETLTAQIADAAWKLFQDIESKGGMSKELLAGNIQATVKAVRAERVKNLSSRKDVLIGTNKYPNMAEKEVHVAENNYEELYNKYAKIADDAKSNDSLKAVPQNGLSIELIDSLTDAFIGGANIYNAVTYLCGSICNSEVTAEKVNTDRLAVDFETIRENSELFKAKNGSYPKIFLANMGPLKQHKPRADFSQDFFATGGFEIIYNQGFESNEAAAKAALASESNVIVICSTDDTYPEIVPELAAAIKAGNKDKFIVLAGYPTEHIEAFKSAGVDEFIHIKSNIYSILFNIQKQLGIA